MKAVTFSQYGPPDVLQVTDEATPTPGDNQVLIRVGATAVNPLDWHILRGDPFLIRLMGFGIMKPKHRILGADVAGRVEAVGKDVTEFKVGDEVFGSGLGGFAEYVCIAQNNLVLKSPAMTYEQAAAVPIAGLTALQALRDHGRLRPGQHVLINGASGGVGTFATQIAKTMGAKVTGVCSEKNVELVRSIGADHVIDYTKEDYWASEKQFDLIVDNAAFYSIGKPLSALKAAGRYVTVGGSSSTLSIILSQIVNPLVAMMKRKKVISFIAKINQTDLIFLRELMEDGKVVSVVDRKYALDETPEALRYIEQGHTRGKIVVAMADK